ncbi:aromatic amino acid lyase, partial [candidate division KSB1 bacterium]|nr:aromatic amino acid lyase [candidate division KSB1 bacterium]
MSSVIIDGQSLTLAQIHEVAEGGVSATLSDSALSEMQKSRDCIEAILQSGRTVYGVNTGFGKLANVHVPPDELEELQLNLVLSHACGIGEPIPAPIVRAAMLLKINSLAKGFSGSRPLIAERLLELLNRNIVPIVPCKGSVGASGDLAPLAHLTLVLL